MTAVCVRERERTLPTIMGTCCLSERVVLFKDFNCSVDLWVI